MSNTKDLLMREIRTRAWHRTGVLAGQLVSERSERKGLILDELEFRRWLAESCDDCLACR